MHIGVTISARALARRLTTLGASFFMMVRPDGSCSFTFRFSTLPPSKTAAAIAALIQQRFAADEQFRSDLFDWLHANGRLFRRPTDPLPDQPLEENWTSLGNAAGSVVGKLAERICRAGRESERSASPTLASNR